MRSRVFAVFKIVAIPERRAENRSNRLWRKIDVSRRWLFGEAKALSPFLGIVHHLCHRIEQGGPRECSSKDSSADAHVCVGG